MAPQPVIVRANSSQFVVQALPDGSTALFEVATRNVYSLNASAAAAWEACASPASLPAVAAAMSSRLNAPITEELAHEAVAELAAAGLVAVTEGDGFVASRRAVLRQVAGVALPMVLVLTGAEQRAHAQGTGSPPVPTTQPPGTTSGPTTPPPGTTSPPLLLQIHKGFRDANTPTQALAGAEFDVRNSLGQVVAHLVTDLSGLATVLLPAGTYTIVETDAPGGLDQFEPFGVHTVQLIPPFGAIRDYTNILKAE